MADVRPLLYVTAFVIAGLAVWVISVLARKGEPWKIEASRAPEPPAAPET